MTRKPGPGPCVHCLKEVPRRNWDHVFPRGWYPDTTPQNLEKWKIPTCKACNDEYGRMEDELGIILSTCINPDSAHASGIWKKTMRALDPTKGTSEKDRKARAKKREQVLSQLIEGKDIPDHGIYPGLGERWQRPLEQQIAVMVPAKYLQKLAEKIVKGLAFLEEGNLLNPDTKIVHHVVDGDEAKYFEELLSKFGKQYSKGPGILVKRALTPEDNVTALFKITIWGEFILYVTVVQNPSKKRMQSDAAKPHR